MTVTIKARSPNYPQKPLDWALNSALNILARQGVHPLPADVVAGSMGYKNANSGPARSAMAVLKTFGMLEKSGGKLIVSESVQRYKLAPSQAGKDVILKQWLMTPPLFNKLLEKYGYPDPLPTDEVIIHDLVFDYKYAEAAAKKIVETFRRSIELVPSNGNGFEDNEAEGLEEGVGFDGDKPAPAPTPVPSSPSPAIREGVRYPVRLAGGRMAYIEVPEDFYNKDKIKLKAQLEVIGTLDEDESFEF